MWLTSTFERANSKAIFIQAMDKFFAAVYAAILRHLPFHSLKAIVIASPGFTRESVSSHLRDVKVKRD